VKLSFGTASTRGGKGSREVLMAEADQAMYRDKFRRGAGRRR
jgi:GGDEF domain-containing protein